MLFANLLAGILCFGAPNVGDGNLRAPLPGRRVKVATIAIGRAGNRNSDQHEKKLRLALEHLETAGQQGVDIACLPEEFCGTTPEPIPGPITQAVAELANKYHMYVVCPMCERTADGLEYNTAALLDRTGVLSHWVVIEDNKIKNYQCVVPSTWNAGPRNQNDAMGPYEASLVGNPVADPDRPLEVVRTVHSFDPCLACAIHLVDPKGQSLIKVKVQ